MQLRERIGQAVADAGAAEESRLTATFAAIADGTADTETLRQFARLQSELRGTPKSPAGREGK